MKFHIFSEILGKPWIYFIIHHSLDYVRLENHQSFLFHFCRVDHDVIPVSAFGTIRGTHVGRQRLGLMVVVER